MSSSAFALSLVSVFAAAHPNSICEQDDRGPSAATQVGVVLERLDKAGPFCTITLISDGCALTAGHCLVALGEARFFVDQKNTPEKREGEFVYPVDQRWIRALQSRIGNDWAVVRLKANPKTGLLPGKVHGFIEPEVRRVEISDVGLELHAIEKAADRSYQRVKASGQLLWTESSIIYHDLDTLGGSSGALVIDVGTGKAIGIHTHGGCDTMKNNKATFISEVPNLVKAIEACRSSF